MSVATVMARVARNDRLEDVLKAIWTLAPDDKLTHREVMALSHYVRRLSARSSDSSIEPLVALVNDKFVRPMFDPTADDPNRYEPKTMVFGLERFSNAQDIRAVLSPLLAAPTLETLQGLVESHGEAAVMAVVAPLIARTPKDLYAEAGGRTPAATRLQRIWKVIEAVVEGSGPVPPPVGELVPELRRPLELRQASPLHGWARLRGYAEHGVPYELLIMQRSVGTAFGTAQNASSEQVASYLSDTFLARYASGVGLPFLRAIDGEDRPYPPYVSKAEMERITGVVPSPDIAFVHARGPVLAQWLHVSVPGYRAVPRDYSVDDVVAVVEAKVASDGGTARQKCDELRRQFSVVANRPGILAAALVDGSGWNQRRAEVSRLALDIAGQLYRLAAAEALVEAIRERGP